MSEQVKIYEPGNKHKKISAIFKDMFRDLSESKNLGYTLFIRDKKGEYRQSFLGILWAIFTPLSTALIWIFLSSSGAVRISKTHIPYPAYVLIGTMLWSIFSESLLMPLTETQNAKPILAKVNFPKEAILISGFYKNLFNGAIKLLLITFIMIIYGVTPGFSLLYFPLLFCVLILLGYSIGLLLTPVGMLYKDIGRALPIILSLLMYFSPVVYKGGTSGKIAKIIEINPLTPIINSLRNALSDMPLENVMYMAITFLCSAILFFIAWIFYRISIPIIVERL